MVKIGGTQFALFDNAFDSVTTVLLLAGALWLLWALRDWVVLLLILAACAVFVGGVVILAPPEWSKPAGPTGLIAIMLFCYMLNRKKT